MTDPHAPRVPDEMEEGLKKYQCSVCKGMFYPEKTIELGNGKKVCATCAEYSPMVVECDRCKRKFIAYDAVRDDGRIICLGCKKQPSA